MWSSEEIESEAVARDTQMKQSEIEGQIASQIATLCQSVGFKEPECCTFVPTGRFYFPELHDSIGADEKALKSFWDFVCDRIKVFPE